MNKLNQEYAKARKKHEEDVSSNAWLKVIPIIVILLGVMFWAMNKTDEIGQQRAKETLQNIEERILASPKTQGPKKVMLENLGLSVELHEGLNFDYAEQEKLLTATSMDTNELAYLIGEVPTNMQKPNMKERWIDALKKGDPNLIFRDSLDRTIIETTKNGKKYQGILSFKALNNRQMVIQAVALKNAYRDWEPKMNDVIESLKTE